MKKRALLAGAAVFALLALAGCGPATGGMSGTEYELSETSITLQDGRTVTCVVVDGYNMGGVSCDWAGAE